MGAGPGPAADGAPTVPGRRLVLPIALALLLALGIVVVYKLQDHPQPTMSFQRLGPAAAFPNATVLPFKPVHDAYFLEDHLATAAQKGNSTETIALRVETMESTLRTLTGHEGPWVVAWNDVAVRVAVA
jgi:hypothetical protein